MNAEDVREQLQKLRSAMDDPIAADHYRQGVMLAFEAYVRNVEGLLKPLVDDEPIVDWKDYDHSICAYCLKVTSDDMPNQDDFHDSDCVWLTAKQAME